MTVLVPRYTESGKRAIDLFLAEGNSYVFYFEDTNAEVFYERLIMRLFPNAGRFRVVSLHGKDNVFKKARGPRVTGVNYVFVVDKDFDDLLGKVVEGIPDIFYLEKYSVENFLLDLNALVRVLVEEHPEAVAEQLAMAQCEDFVAYNANLQNRYTEVTGYFVAAQKFRVQIENTKINATSTWGNDNEYHPMPSVEWLADYRARFLEKALVNPGSSWLNDAAALDHVLMHIFEAPSPFPLGPVPQKDHIPGKHLLTCLTEYLSVRVHPGLQEMHSLKLYIRLLNHIDIAVFQPLKSRIAEAYPALA